MKTSRFSDCQILAILHQAANGVPVPELCREQGMSSTAFCKRRAKFGGMAASLMARMKEPERVTGSVHTAVRVGCLRTATMNKGL